MQTVTLNWLKYDRFHFGPLAPKSTNQHSRFKTRQPVRIIVTFPSNCNYRKLAGQQDNQKNIPTPLNLVSLPVGTGAHIHKYDLCTCNIFLRAALKYTYAARALFICSSERESPLAVNLPGNLSNDRTNFNLIESDGGGTALPAGQNAREVKRTRARTSSLNHKSARAPEYVQMICEQFGNYARLTRARADGSLARQSGKDGRCPGATGGQWSRSRKVKTNQTKNRTPFDGARALSRSYVYIAI